MKTEYTAVEYFEAIEGIRLRHEEEISKVRANTIDQLIAVSTKSGSIENIQREMDIIKTSSDECINMWRKWGREAAQKFISEITII